MKLATKPVTAALGAVLTVAVMTTSPPAQAASSVGGSISREEVLDRAQYWVDRNVIYSQNRTFPDEQGKKYRTDCSGLVSQAWHMSTAGTYLDGGLNTDGFRAYSGKTVLGSVHDLKAGDALLRNGHIELFARWKDADDHRDGAFVYSLNGPTDGDWAKGPKKNTNGQVGFNTWAEMTTYTPIRYDKITDGPVWVKPENGKLYREPSGLIAVIIGGAPARFQSMAELVAAGYENTPFTQVPANYFRSLSQTPRNGSYVRDFTTKAISVVVGGVKYHLTAAEWDALGKPAAINAPASFLDDFDTTPVSGTVLRDHGTGAIHIVAGGARYHLSAAQYAALDSPPFTNVPAGFVNSLPTRPADGTYLRNPATSAIYLIVGGAKYHLTSMAELDEVGAPTFTNVPMEWIATFGSTVADNTYLRNPADGAIHRIMNGTKDHLTYEEWTALGKPAFTDVPIAFLNSFPEA